MNTCSPRWSIQPNNPAQILFHFLCQFTLITSCARMSTGASVRPLHYDLEVSASRRRKSLSPCGKVRYIWPSPGPTTAVTSCIDLPFVLSTSTAVIPFSLNLFSNFHLISQTYHLHLPSRIHIKRASTNQKYCRTVEDAPIKYTQRTPFSIFIHIKASSKLNMHITSRSTTSNSKCLQELRLAQPES